MPDPPGKEVQLKAGNAEIGQMSEVRPSNVLVVIHIHQWLKGCVAAAFQWGEQTLHRLLITPLGRKELDAVLILIPEIKSRMILCAEDENHHKPMEQPKRHYPCLLFKGFVSIL